MPTKTIFLNSAQASIKNLANGQATWQFRNPLQFDGAEVGLFSLDFTNYFINISAALGNNHLFYSDDIANETKYDVTIPDGSYSVTALNDFLIAEQQATLGIQVFALVANFSTAKVGIQFANVVNWYVHFGANSPYTLMGFANGQEVPATKTCTAYYIEYAPNTASFNNITAIKVAIDITTDTVSNGEGSSVIYQTSPIVEPGSTQTSSPSNILWCALTTPSFSQVTVRILDQTEAAIVLTEDFSVTIGIRY